MRMKWLYLKHDETGGVTEIPDTRDVREWHEARGWKVIERPEELPFVPEKRDMPPGVDNDWVTLFHPDVSTTHNFPNNPEAIAGAMESGWEFPVAYAEDSEPPAGQTITPDPSDSKPDPKPRKSRASASADSEKENG